MYKFGMFEGEIIRLADGAIIPEDPGNMDYIAYLDWVTGGGITEAPDQLPPGTVVATLIRAVRAASLPS